MVEGSTGWILARAIIERLVLIALGTEISPSLIVVVRQLYIYLS
jgi:hypothetical protein